MSKQGIRALIISAIIGLIFWVLFIICIAGLSMVKNYADVQVIDLLCIYEIQGEESTCDADNQEVVIESTTYEWLTGAL